MPLAGGCACGVGALGRRRTGVAPDPAAGAATSRPGAPARHLPSDLLLVGLQALGVSALLSCDVPARMLVRYTLLGLFVPVGLAASALQPGGPPWLGRLAILGSVLVAATAAIDHGRVLAEYVGNRPPNTYRMLADYLEREGIQYGAAPYWTAYHVDFLTDERVTLTAYEKIRVREYDDIVSAHDRQSVGIFIDDPCTDEGAVTVSRWCLTYVERARNADLSDR
jgi:hypothetical protein